MQSLSTVVEIHDAEVAEVMTDWALTYWPNVQWLTEVES